MWSWTHLVSNKSKDFASYNHHISVFLLSNTPFGEVYIKQTSCPDQQSLLSEVAEHRKVADVQHPLLVECLDWREEQQPDGSGFVYEIYPKLEETIDVGIRRRCMDEQTHYPEDYLWHTLKQFIDLHALLQSKVFPT